MTHIQSRSYRNKRGKEQLVDKHGRTLGVYDSITEATKAAKLISATSETKPKRKPKFGLASPRYPNGYDEDE